ncbi:hypothetical protein ACL1G7_13210 [Corynebacterium striatum]
MIVEQMAQIVERLEEAGLKATINPPGVHPPCAWVAPREIVGGRLDGERLYNFVVMLIAPSSLDIPRAFITLDSMLDQAMKAIGGWMTHSDLGVEVTLPDGSSCPAFSLIIEPS